MQIAIAHYHLNRGGVTQVIANHLRALDVAVPDGERLRVLLLYGGRREGWPEDLPAECPRLDIQLAEVPELEYDDGKVSDIEPLSLQFRIEDVLGRNGFEPEETLLHIHNHALGKNTSVPVAAALLARKGVRLLLQVHDFAEDFRPDLYRKLVSLTAREGDTATLPELLYPQAPQIHYAVLNGRDRNVLANAGVEESQLHWLPNPVAAFGELPSQDEARTKLAERFGIASDVPLLLYPVRGIRRKNLGEMLLCSAALGDAASFAVTLTPMNPAERVSHDAWRTLAEKLGLSCYFGVGDADGLSFTENISAADAIVTTSVAEGFGMVYLEAWLAGRPLVGRNLPEITDDFVAQGLRLDAMYDSLAVPLDWIGEQALRGSVARIFEQVLGQYDRKSEMADRFEPFFDDLINDTTSPATVDFATLDVPLQRAVIESVHRDAERREQLVQLNPKIGAMAAASVADAARPIAHNRVVISEDYSLEVFGKRLYQLYQKILSSEDVGRLNALPAGTSILDTFLDVRRLRPVRTDADS